MQILDNNTHDKIEQSIADIDWTAYQQRAFTASILSVVPWPRIFTNPEPLG